MSSVWSFPAPSPGGAGRAGRAGEVWPLDGLEPRVLMMLGPELRRMLDRLQPGAVVAVGYGPDGPYLLQVPGICQRQYDREQEGL